MYKKTVNILEIIAIVGLIAVPTITVPIISIENSLVQLATLASMPQNQAMSIRESNSKIMEPKWYKKVISNPIYGCCQTKAIKDKLQNLENYQIWKYDKLLLD